MITTIQLDEKVKKSLDRMKGMGKETYEEVIVEMMRALEEQKRRKNELMIEGYQEIAEENLKITREFEAIEENFDWKWEK